VYVNTTSFPSLGWFPPLSSAFSSAGESTLTQERKKGRVKEYKGPKRWCQEVMTFQGGPRGEDRIWKMFPRPKILRMKKVGTTGIRWDSVEL